MRTALTIAGSDSSGGAGIQADIKTMTANGVFALCAVTALTAQNTTGVTDIFDSTPHFLAEQLDAVFTDILPDAVKIGMVSSAELIETIAAKLKEYGAKHIVVDPVMVATSGAKLLRDDAVTALCEKLLPLAEVLTPNIPEAEILSGMTIQNAADMERAAQTISEKYGCAVLCKGGHQINDADDLLWRDGAGKWFKGRRIDNPNTHGTGCTLSSAIASNLAKGYDLDTSVERAKAYISGALAHQPDAVVYGLRLYPARRFAPRHGTAGRKYHGRVSVKRSLAWRRITFRGVGRCAWCAAAFGKGPDPLRRKAQGPHLDRRVPTPRLYIFSGLHRLGLFPGSLCLGCPSAAVPPACRLVAEHTAHNAAEHRYTAGGRACFGGALPASAARNVVRSTVPAQRIGLLSLGIDCGRRVVFHTAHGHDQCLYLLPILTLP